MVDQLKRFGANFVHTMNSTGEKKNENLKLEGSAPPI